MMRGGYQTVDDDDGDIHIYVWVLLIVMMLPTMVGWGVLGGCRQ